MVASFPLELAMTTRILTWNVNGLRAAIRKGLEHWLEELKPDVVMLQEIRARPDQLPDQWRSMDGWHVQWNPAERPGYSGTCIWSRRPIDRVEVGIAGKSDPEGRMVLARIGDLDVASIYLPSGSSSEDAHRRKQKWMKDFAPHAGSLMRRRRSVLLGGDFNIARSERDIFHWKSNIQQQGDCTVGRRGATTKNILNKMTHRLCRSRIHCAQKQLFTKANNAAAAASSNVLY